MSDEIVRWTVGAFLSLATVVAAILVIPDYVPRNRQIAAWLVAVAAAAAIVAALVVSAPRNPSGSDLEVAADGGTASPSAGVVPSESEPAAPAGSNGRSPDESPRETARPTSEEPEPPTPTATTTDAGTETEEPDDEPVAPPADDRTELTLLSETTTEGPGGLLFTVGAGSDLGPSLLVVLPPATPQGVTPFAASGDSAVYEGYLIEIDEVREPDEEQPRYELDLTVTATAEAPDVPPTPPTPVVVPAGTTQDGPGGLRLNVEEWYGDEAFGPAANVSLPPTEGVGITPFAKRGDFSEYEGFLIFIRDTLPPDIDVGGQRENYEVVFLVSPQP